MRERLIALALVGALSLGGCTEKDVKPKPADPVGISTPVVGPKPPGEIVIPTPIPPEILWETLPPIERIRRLEEKRYPEIRGFDQTRELARAVAHFYCEQTKCNITPEQITENIIFVPAKQEFAKLMAKEIEITREKLGGGSYPTSPEDLEPALAMTSRRTREIFINRQALEETLTKTPKETSDGRDFRTAFIKSLLLHEFSHLNTKKEKFEFEPILLSEPSVPFTLWGSYIDRFDTFDLVGKQRDGRLMYVTGLSEAIAEFAAANIGIKTGGYVVMDKEAFCGARFILGINNRVGITSSEFLHYTSGERSIRELLQRWATLADPSRPDEKAAIEALLAIGLYVQGFIKEEQAVTWIERTLQISQLGRC